MPGESKSSRRRIDARHRQAEALTLRTAGASFDQIARQLGYANKSGAYLAVKAALDRVPMEAAYLYRKLNLDRLNRLLMASWQAATAHKPDPSPTERMLALRATATCLAILAEQAKLLGLYAPQKIDITQRIEELATELGVEKEAAVREAMRVLRESGG